MSPVRAASDTAEKSGRRPHGVAGLWFVMTAAKPAADGPTRSRRSGAQTHRPVSRKRSLVFADRHLAGLFLFGQLDITFARVGVGGIDFWGAFAANSGDGQGEKGSEQKERPSLLHGNAFRGNMTANTAAMQRNKNVIEAEQPKAKTWPV